MASETNYSVSELVDLMNRCQHNTAESSFEGELTDAALVRNLCRVAGDTTSKVEILELLACHHASVVREAVADNPNLPPQILALLSRDQSVDVRHAIAENHNIPLSILEDLVLDENPYVSHRARQTLARIYCQSMVRTNCKTLKLEKRHRLNNAYARYSY